MRPALGGPHGKLQLTYYFRGLNKVGKITRNKLDLIVDMLTNTTGHSAGKFSKECVAVLTMLYKKNGAVSGVGSDFLSDWTLYSFFYIK